MNKPNKVICTSSYDQIKMWYNKIYETSRENKPYLRLLWERVFHTSFTIALSQQNEKEENVLWPAMQNRVEHNYSRILEGEKDTFLPKTQQRHTWSKESKLEGWKKIGQRWVLAYLATLSSPFRLSWLHQGAQTSNGEETRTVSYIRGGGAS